MICSPLCRPLFFFLWILRPLRQKKNNNKNEGVHRHYTSTHTFTVYLKLPVFHPSLTQQAFQTASLLLFESSVTTLSWLWYSWSPKTYLKLADWILQNTRSQRRKSSIRSRNTHKFMLICWGNVNEYCQVSSPKKFYVSLVPTRAQVSEMHLGKDPLFYQYFSSYYYY